MNFNNARKHLNGKFNFLANFGMLGDSLVFISLYLLYKYRKNKKEAAYEKNLEEQTKQNLTLYPKKTEQIEYNRFSPYTPIPYYVDEVTKWQSYDIDLINYLNDNQVNLNTYYYKDYNDSYTPDEKKKWTLDWHDAYSFMNGKKNTHNSHH